MSFKNVPENIKKLAGGTPEEVAIKLYKQGFYPRSVAVVLNNMVSKQRVAFFLYAIQKTPLRAYKQGLDLLKNATQTLLNTDDIALGQRLLKEYRKNFPTNSKFDIIANHIIDEVFYTPNNVSDYSRDEILHIIYDFPYTFQNDYKQQYTEALADLLEFQFNNKNFRLMYGKF